MDKAERIFLTQTGPAVEPASVFAKPERKAASASASASGGGDHKHAPESAAAAATEHKAASADAKPASAAVTVGTVRELRRKLENVFDVEGIFAYCDVLARFLAACAEVLAERCPYLENLKA